PIPPELIYGADESGFQSGVGTRERVIGRQGKKVQHQQRSGGRENMTVLVTICADGTSLAPAVIFKGMGYQTSWKQENPLNAFLGYQKKGYIDGEIGVEWIKQFDAQTREKATGRRRLLLVDGHNSHFTLGFIRYSRENKIEVVCYPSHSTHLYQGLDVVIFSILKRCWSEARDMFERQRRGKVNKTNFLKIYAEAHVKTLTPENIHAAFQKTGIVPFNPAVITEEMMAPSLTWSIEEPLPFPMEEPTK
ncbi:hypothetical protein M378DRAFT_49547, partial [Amanita muscaria Koide BX008]